MALLPSANRQPGCGLVRLLRWTERDSQREWLSPGEASLSERPWEVTHAIEEHLLQSRDMPVQLSTPYHSPSLPQTLVAEFLERTLGIRHCLYQ